MNESLDAVNGKIKLDLDSKLDSNDPITLEHIQTLKTQHQNNERLKKALLPLNIDLNSFNLDNFLQETQ